MNSVAVTGSAMVATIIARSMLAAMMCDSFERFDARRMM